jgi:GntR family transcriptional regulator, arabinose operon transcriptional repressor
LLTVQKSCNVSFVPAQSGKIAKPKYLRLLESLSNDILSGRFKTGAKLPSEAALVKKFGISRITVGRALRELQNRGLVDRIAGSGTYVRRGRGHGEVPLIFGLLIPDLGEKEIFEPICQGIANARQASSHALLWGHTDVPRDGKEEQAWQLCRQYIARKVSGVFFAPLEFEIGADKANRRIVSALRESDIPVVLLDRRPSGTPERGRPDLVGINNRQAGFLATEHLVKLGCKRIGFLGYHGSAPTIVARMAGYQEALTMYGLAAETNSAVRVEPGHEQVELLKDKPQIEAFVCVNDRVAGHLMHSFMAQHIRIPEDIRIVGIDDVAYASLLPVPLTTVRQPCRAIGEAALSTMLSRIEAPKIPARDVLLDGELVVRKSCGTSLSPAPPGSSPVSPV